MEFITDNPFYIEMVDVLQNPQTWKHVLLVLLKILIYFILGRVVVALAVRTIKHVILERKMEKSGPVRIQQRRAQTVGRLIQSIISYSVHAIVVMLILSEFNVELAPLLAGAGIVGIAIGFGAQSLVRDIITGVFIIFEDQFAVGDVVKIAEFQGTVEEIGLRVTRIKSWTGEVHIIPNGSINQVTNFSINNSIAVVDVSISYEADIERALQVIKDAVAVSAEKITDVVKEPEVLGVQTLGVSDIVVRVTAECKPMTHNGVARQLRAMIKKALHEEGIDIPYPKLVTFKRE